MQSATQLIKDIIFPVFCIACQQEGTWWCAACRTSNPPALVTACPVCSAPTARGEVCSDRCRAVSALDGVTALFNYDEQSPIGRLIQQFKYQYARDIAAAWKAVLSSPPFQGGVRGWLPEQPAVIPVPLHPRRTRERGFNQAAVIGKLLAEQLGYPLDEIQLIRQRYTEQQAKLDRAARQENVRDAFTWAGSAAPARVILVDDVFTTGATMQACARELKNHGTAVVWGVTLARG